MTFRLIPLHEDWTGCEGPCGVEFDRSKDAPNADGWCCWCVAEKDGAA